jgi:hypothetical protein
LTRGQLKWGNRDSYGHDRRKGLDLFKPLLTKSAFISDSQQYPLGSPASVSLAHPAGRLSGQIWFVRLVGIALRDFGGGWGLGYEAPIAYPP